MEGIAIDAEVLRSQGLILLGVLHYYFEHGLFHHTQNHAVNIVWGVAIEVGKIALQLRLNTFANGVFIGHRVTQSI